MKNLTYASSLKRLVAFFIDGIFLFFFDILVGVLLNPKGGTINAQFGISFDFSSPEKMISNFVNFAYFIVLTALWGKTIGKKIMGIKVVNIENTKTPSFGKVLIRETIGKLVSFLALGIGLIWIIFDSKKQGWHDKIAKTSVVST